MTTRTGALVKDIAALFAKYGLGDWAPIVDELERGGRSQLANAIAELAATAPKPRRNVRTPGAKKARKATPKLPAVAISSDRAELLAPLADALSAKQVLPTVGDVRSTFVALGLKGQPPTRRADGVNAIISHLNGVNQDRLAAAVEVVKREAARSNGTDSYQRWFDLIGADPGVKSPLA